MILTASERRWMRLSTLLIALEKGMAAAARIDGHAVQATHTKTLKAITIRAAAFSEELSTLERRINRELDRLTADRLKIELMEKIAQDRKHPLAFGEERCQERLNYN